MGVKESMRVEVNSRQNGFTLIEILVVLFICSLVVLPALYNWQQQLQRFRLIDAARQVAGFIYSNLMEGIYLNQHRVLQVNNDQGRWNLVVNNVATGKEISRLSDSKLEGIGIKKTTRTSIDLYGKQGTSHAFSIELQNENEVIIIYLSAIGRLRGCSKQKMVGIPRC